MEQLRKAIIILNEYLFRNSKAFHRKNFRTSSVNKKRCFVVRHILTITLGINIKLWEDFQDLSIIPFEISYIFTLNSIKIEKCSLHQEESEGKIAITRQILSSTQDDFKYPLVFDRKEKKNVTNSILILTSSWVVIFFYVIIIQQVKRKKACVLFYSDSFCPQLSLFK